MSRFDTAERVMERRISALEERIADLEEDVARLQAPATDRSERARKALVTRKANAAREAMGNGD